jgi:hypothetical protein
MDRAVTPREMRMMTRIFGERPNAAITRIRASEAAGRRLTVGKDPRKEVIRRADLVYIEVVDETLGPHPGAVGELPRPDPSVTHSTGRESQELLHVLGAQ